MPSEVALKISPATPKDTGVFFNAFSNTEPTVTTNTGTMISESIPRKRKPLQRRGSDSTPSSTSRNSGQLSARLLGHSRSKTEQWSPGVHPLGSGAITFGRSTTGAASSDSGITRPHLSRIISTWESPAGSDGESKGSSSDAGSFLEQAPPREVEEKAVLVHEVSSPVHVTQLTFILKYKYMI